MWLVTIAFGCAGVDAAGLLWKSSLEAIEDSLNVTVFSGGYSQKTAIVLANIPSVRVSEDLAKKARQQLLDRGFRIVQIDYEEHVAASFPDICKDIAKLRSDIFNGLFLSDLNLDQARIFIVPEGQVVETDVLYFEDEGRALGMDISFPLLESETDAVPCIMEFSCDNKDRMGNYSLVACRDTLLEGLGVAGYATAMADHPVAAPYKGIDPMPDCGIKVKSAVRTLRAVGKDLSLSGEIGVVGFSRGSGMALLLATSDGSEAFDNVGFYSEYDSSVQAAVVLSGRFTYLDLLEEDHMIPRYEKAWGVRDLFLDKWTKQGSLDYLEASTIPLFLSINSGEGADAQLQMGVLRHRLSELGSEFVYVEDVDGVGHKVPIDPMLLSGMEAYLNRQFRSK